MHCEIQGFKYIATVLFSQSEHCCDATELSLLIGFTSKQVVTCVLQVGVQKEATHRLKGLSSVK